MQDLHNVFQHFRLGKGNVYMLNDLVPRKICSGMKSIYPLAVANLSQTYQTFGLLAGQTPLPIVDAVVQTSDGWHRSIGRTSVGGGVHYARLPLVGGALGRTPPVGGALGQTPVGGPLCLVLPEVGHHAPEIMQAPSNNSSHWGGIL